MFRFEKLNAWQEAIEISDELFDIADEVDSKRLFRFAEQLRGAALSISNNIAEGSGSFSNKDFANYLNIARRSVFECANILIILHRRKIIIEEVKTGLLFKLDRLSRQITTFRKTLI
ncbi:MAG: four helix bundle protein [Bacteroidales bacterium]|nr:four helix bundle protein [Bacteroidales bacterium]